MGFEGMPAKGLWRPAVWKFINEYAHNATASLNALNSSTVHGFFAPACLIHTGFTLVRVRVHVRVRVLSASLPLARLCVGVRYAHRRTRYLPAAHVHTCHARASSRAAAPPHLCSRVARASLAACITDGPCISLGQDGPLIDGVSAVGALWQWMQGGTSGHPAHRMDSCRNFFPPCGKSCPPPP